MPAESEETEPPTPPKKARSRPKTTRAITSDSQVLSALEGKIDSAVGSQIQEILSHPKISGELKSRDTPEQVKSRIRIEEDDARHERWRETGLQILAGSLVVLFAVGFFCVVVSPASSADDKKWATGALASIVAGVIGIVTGRATK